MANLEINPFRIGQWVVYPHKRLISNNPEDVDLSPTLMNLLLYLVQNCHRVVSREELLEHVWSGSVVSDESISRAVAHLRKSLGDSAKNPVFIKTISKQGYQFLVEPDFEVTTVATEEQAKGKLPWMVVSMLSLVLLAVVSWQLFNHDGSEQKAPLYKRPLTDNRLLQMSPRFSKDGRFIVFSEYGSEPAHGALVVQDLTTKVKRTLLETEDWAYLSPAFSPSGNEIVYHQTPITELNSAHHCKVFVYSFISGENRQMGRCDAMSDSPVSWSHDGKSLYSTRMVFEQMRSGLVSTDMATGSVSELLFPEQDNMIYMSPQLSPSGESLLFQIYDISARTISLARFNLTSREVTPVAQGRHSVKRAVWGKDDETIYFADGARVGAGIWQVDVASDKQSYMYNQNIQDFDYDATSDRFVVSIAQGNSNIWLAKENADGTLSNQIMMDSIHNEAQVSISYDGKRLAYFSDKGGERNLWVTTLQDNRHIQLTDTEKLGFNNLYWSKDGSMLSTVVTDKGEKQLWVVDSLQPGNVIAKLDNVAYANWHDGSQVLNVVFKGTDKPGGYHWHFKTGALERVFEQSIFKFATVAPEHYVVQKVGFGPMFSLTFDSSGEQRHSLVWQALLDKAPVPHFQLDQGRLSALLIDENNRTYLQQVDPVKGQPKTHQYVANSAIIDTGQFAIDNLNKQIYYINYQSRGTNLFLLEQMVE